VLVDVDADDLVSIKDSIYNSSSSSSSSISSSYEDHPNSASIAPPEEMEMEPPMKNLTLMLQMLQCQILLLYHSSLLETISRP